MNNSLNELNNTCKYIYKKDAINLSSTIIRTIILTLYLIWIKFGIKFKEFHKRQMVFLYNLNIAGLFYSFFGLLNLFKRTCWTPTPFQCMVTSLQVTFNSYLPGYCLSALFLYRWACTYYLQIKLILAWPLVIFYLLLTWLIPLALTIGNLFLFNQKFGYSKELATCLVITPENDLRSIIFFTIFSIIIPNAFIIVAHLAMYFRINSNRRFKEPCRITIQLLLTILTFEIYSFSSLLVFYQVSMSVEIIPNNYIHITRVIRWLYHFCPLCFLYTHSVMLKKFKNIQILR